MSDTCGHTVQGIQTSWHPGPLYSCDRPVGHEPPHRERRVEWADTEPPASLPPRPWQARDSRVLDADGNELFLIHNVDHWQQDFVASWLVSMVNKHAPMGDD